MNIKFKQLFSQNYYEAQLLSAVLFSTIFLACRISSYVLLYEMKTNTQSQENIKVYGKLFVLNVEILSQRSAKQWKVLLFPKKSFCSV